MIDTKELLKNKDKFMDILKVDSMYAELINNPPEEIDEEYEKLMNPVDPDYKELLFELSKKYRDKRGTISLIKQCMSFNADDSAKLEFISKILLSKNVNG